MSETVRFLAGTNIDIKDFIHFFLGQVQKKLKKLKNLFQDFAVYYCRPTSLMFMGVKLVSLILTAVNW